MVINGMFLYVVMVTKKFIFGWTRLMGVLYD